MTTRRAHGNYYEECRKLAGMTQEQAAEALFVSVRSLSDYETSKTQVSDEIVDNMVTIYRTPMLAWWHIKNTSKLGRHLPDIQMPETPGDMGFQTILSLSDVRNAKKIITDILSDGGINSQEHEGLQEYRRVVSLAASRLLSAQIFVDNFLMKGKEENRLER